MHTTWHDAAVQPTLLLGPTVKSQVAAEVQPRLALFPAVTVQVLPPLHVPLHELPQVPWQLPVAQVSEQLATDGSHPICVNELLLPPHPASIANPTATETAFMMTPRYDALGALSA